MAIPSMYRFSFAAIGEEYGPVRFWSHRKPMCRNLHLMLDDSEIHSVYPSGIPSAAADLIDLAVAVHFADRMIPALNDEIACIEIELPVRNPEICESVCSSLKSILWWYTRMDWSFRFRLRTTSVRSSECRQYLPFSEDIEQTDEVALWSGGLDSLAGLVNRLVETESRSVALFGTGSNEQTLHRQRQVYGIASQSFFPRISLVQMPIRWKDTALLNKNRYARSRGFVFVLLGAVYAYLQGHHSLHIYENGIGAINLPFTSAEVGIDHTRAVHPESLLYIESLLSCILGEPFQIVNPFLFKTKAQMCQVLRERQLEQLAYETVSCDRTQRDVNAQCGYCSSCILRRQALAAASIIDKTSYYVPHSRTASHNDFMYFHVMGQQVNHLERLAVVGSNTWQAFRNAHSTELRFTKRLAQAMSVSPDFIESQLVALFDQYVHEWRQVEGRINDLLQNDTSTSTTPSQSLTQGVIPYGTRYT